MEMYNAVVEASYVELRADSESRFLRIVQMVDNSQEIAVA
jgi:hypothetical protein